MKRLITIICIALINIGYTYSQYPTVNSSRPRVWISANRLTDLQTLKNTPGQSQTSYNNIANKYQYNIITYTGNFYLDGTDSTNWVVDFENNYIDEGLEYLSFMYGVDKDPLDLKRARFVASEFVSYYASFNPGSYSWYNYETIMRKLGAMDFLFDQCSDDFPTALRNSLAQAMYDYTNQYMQDFMNQPEFISGHFAKNFYLANQHAIVLYNANGLNSTQKNNVQNWYEDLYDMLDTGFIPCWSHFRDDDGANNFGGAYSIWSNQTPFKIFENMRIGTSKNYYNDLIWVKEVINNYYHYFQPNGRTLHQGDGQMDFEMDRMPYILAREYPTDMRSVWLVQDQSNNASSNYDHFLRFFYKDFSAPIVSKPTLPLDWIGDKTGLSVSRSSWNNDATMVSFFNSASKKASHEHRDNNSFAVFKNSPLLLDAGDYDGYVSNHFNNYYVRTIAHNSICVFDQTDNYISFNNSASNDGGQIEAEAMSFYSHISDPDYRRGDWVKYGKGANYAYNVADAHLSYDPDKLTFFRRRLLYLRPEKVIVLDHVHLKNSATQQRDIKWIAHFATQPTMTGSMVNQAVPNRIETYNGDTYSSVNGNGSVSIKTVFPASTEATVIGGSGYEFWVDGTNYPPNTSLPNAGNLTYGTHRIEVEPTTTSDTVVYLHTIDVGNGSSDIALAGGTGLQNNFSIGADWDDTVFFFSAHGDTGETYHMFNGVNGGRTIQIFATDLTDGGYSVLVDGSLVSNVATDGNGIIQTSVVLSAGAHQVEITNNYTTSITNEKIITPEVAVFPNPTNSILNIQLKSRKAPSAIIVYNLLGKEVMKENGKSNIDVSTLSAGKYLIKVTQGENIYNSSFVKN